MVQKVVSAADAARLVRDGDTLTTSGFVGIGVPDALLAALRERFDGESAPRGLTLLFAAGQGDGKERGLNRLAADGLLARVIGGHWGLIPKLGALALEGQVEGHNWPQGVISHLYRDIAAKKPGVLTKVGLDTFVDPRREGGKVSPNAPDLIKLLKLDLGRGDEEFLFYPALPIKVAFLRGTTADEFGNITMEREALILDNLAQAMAAKNSGGVVIVQVERIAATGSLNPRDVVIPGALVDAVVAADPTHHAQTYATAYSAAFAGRLRAPARRASESGGSAQALDARRIIARRAAFELPMGGVVNLGIGMPEGVAAVAAEEGLLSSLTLTAEPGVIGGEPASGLDFGAAVNTDAIIAQNQQFDFYDGGGLDLAVLGMAEVDQRGDVNVSRFGPRLAGAGGFINISQAARRVVFTGSFTSGGLSIALSDGRLSITREGRARKFLAQVEQITYAGARGRAERQAPLYVTERAVFELAAGGLRLAEVAPGLDIERDLLPHMAFAPIIDGPVEMDARIFSPGPMGLARDLLGLDLEARITLDPAGETLFLNFQKLRVRSLGDIERIRARVAALCAPLGRRVDVIVTYDGARIDEEVEHDYFAMVKALEAQFYGRVSRYAGSAFMRMKLGDAFADAPVFEKREQAQAYLQRDGEA